MKHDSFSPLTLILSDLLELAFGCTPASKNFEQLEESVSSYGLDSDKAPSWMLGFVRKIVDREAGELEIPQEGEEDLINVLFDIDHNICPLGFNDYGEGIDWPIPMLGVRVSLCREWRRAGYYGAAIHSVVSYEIPFDPYLPPGDLVHLADSPRRIPDSVMFALRLASPIESLWQRMGNTPVALFSVENDTFVFGRRGFGCWCPLSIITGLYVVPAASGRSQPGWIHLQLEQGQGAKIRRMDLLRSYRYSDRLLLWYEAQAKRLAAVLRLRWMTQETYMSVPPKP